FMAKSLVIVESPAKVKTINKILGPKFKVTSSMGHLIDLPKSTLGVDVDNGFTPKFIVVRTKQKILSKLKKEAEGVKDIYIATDPDREGEAIGWNLVEHIAKGKKVYRVVFHEITKDAVKKAFEHPREFDRKKVDAQNARRVLDRIVGYQISPVLWKKVGSRLSAGRVQSVALRLIVEREEAIKTFVPEEYWQISVDLQKKGIKAVLTAALEKIDGKKAELKHENQVKGIVKEIKAQAFGVSAINVKEAKRYAPPPFITSTIQQEAFSKLGFNTAKTMLIAQELYEGMEIGEEEPVGLITYMRTDSVNISAEAVDKVRGWIKKTYGADHVPPQPNTFKSKKSAQEAHEAIRPTDIARTPEAMKDFLNEDQYRLYNLIWKRFVSCQMTPAVFEQTKIEIAAGRFQFGVSGSLLTFAGYLAVYKDNEEEEVKLDSSVYARGDALELKEVKPSQHFTKPPARFSEATLVKALEEQGIGRPSTYASIIATLVARNYVMRERGYFTATELGIKICTLLIEYFKKVMDIGFTARMEEALDAIEDGDNNYVALLKDFYGPFKEEVDYAMANIEKTHVAVEKPCPDCNRPMVIKWGRRGRFISCTGFPECRHAEPFTTGVKCPGEGCSGELVERRSGRGAMFYGCSRYPECKFIANKLPSGESFDVAQDASKDAEPVEAQAKRVEPPAAV
ncbi:MAG TPA: type I DNA topoisomerase, partial [Candidatus Omnitrophota bacterium]|nr:type I DNA topoisomerase [Candidatus Omnitrophota bacterium]